MGGAFENTGPSPRIVLASFCVFRPHSNQTTAFVATRGACPPICNGTFPRLLAIPSCEPIFPSHTSTLDCRIILLAAQCICEDRLHPGCDWFRRQPPSDTKPQDYDSRLIQCYHLFLRSKIMSAITMKRSS
jgi:hypothetical protein